MKNKYNMGRLKKLLAIEEIATAEEQQEKEFFIKALSAMKTACERKRDRLTTQIGGVLDVVIPGTDIKVSAATVDEQQQYFETLLLQANKYVLGMTICALALDWRCDHLAALIQKIHTLKQAC